MKNRSRTFGLVVWVLTFLPASSFAAGDYCVICKKEIQQTVYYTTDKVTSVKVFICGTCRLLPNDCYLCGLPVLEDFTTLPDQRVLCKRDASSVVLDESAAREICARVKDDLDRQFQGWLSFPDNNVTLGLMDRVTLQEIFHVIGNDYTCPNVLGCVQTRTNDQGRSFLLNLLSGLPREVLITTCVHEYTHIWQMENLPPARAENIGRDAVEGFCELVAYLYATQQGLTGGKSNVLANHYTRGQINLFIAAHDFYGFGDIVDWMKFGRDPLLVRDDLGRVRWLEDRPAPKAAPVEPLWQMVDRTVQWPEKLTLKAITGSKLKPLVIINDRNLAPGEQGRIQLATTNLTIRCLEIRTNSVLIQVGDQGGTEELYLPQRPEQLLKH